MLRNGKMPLALLHNSNGSWMPMPKRTNNTLRENGAKIAASEE